MAKGMLKGWTNRSDEAVEGVIGEPAGTVLRIEEPRSDQIFGLRRPIAMDKLVVPFSRVRWLLRRRGHLAKI
jgi:hypothetical protein